MVAEREVKKRMKTLQQPQLPQSPTIQITEKVSLLNHVINDYSTSINSV